MSSNRASLLSGLRTGGPRSISSGNYVPQTAAPGAQFALPSAQYHSSIAYDHEVGSYADAPGVPMTAPAQDATLANLQQQQQAQLLLLQAQALQNSVMPNSAAFGYQQSGMTMEQQQALQLQFEVYKMQAMHQQQQQLQAQVLQEVQRHMILQQTVQQAPRRRPSEPMTASPYTSSFSMGPKGRAVSGAADGSMTAGLDGRFPASSKLNPNAASFQIPGTEVPANVSNNATASANWRTAERVQPPMPATPGFNGVLSGGTSLGVTGSPAAPSPAKHNLATSWRRPSVPVKPIAERDDSRTPSPSQSVASSPPPTVFVSTPEETSPTTSRSVSPPMQAPAVIGARPKPLLQLSSAAIRERSFDLDNGLPLSPTSPTGSSGQSPAREEAARRLYEGLGIGRPIAAVAAPTPAQAPEAPRQVSQVTRQPLGPPCEVESLGDRNFASRSEAARMRKMNLNVLAGARNRRMSAMIEVEAY